MMFTGLSNVGQQVWLISLLGLWAMLLFGGFLLGDGARRMPTWTRMASSAVLVVAAFSWYAFARGTAAGGYALLIAAGMTFGLLGDLALAGVLPGGRQLIGGIAAFGVGHLFYITAFLRFGSNFGPFDLPRWLALGVWLVVGVIGWYIFVYWGAQRRGVTPGLVNWIVLPYALLLATTAGLAMGLALHDARFVPLALGAALFLFSDLLIASDLFCGLTFPHMDDVIWLTYGPGQMLIVYSIGVVLNRLT